ncbi:HEPN domain-containing protein [Candidatus Bathyarchaeota archaeon]|nr:HEPN domain-containing protein [Desulfobacterales bacterium]NIU81394.1 HEPN domain-containing protein [Candidatus Bathyarchaeota archaeon]NIV68020.1 HEPN domain-containing protein [Candidatus Bathyarchaeota archaeon]
MNRRSLQELARIRLREARTLLRSGYYDGTYYLCGYVVECGLKACIAKRTRRHDFPEKDRVESSYTHNLNTLIKVAELHQQLSKEMKRDSEFASNWGIVKDWKETSRYERRTRQEAEAIYAAITNREHGVLKWIRQHW